MARRNEAIQRYSKKVVSAIGLLGRTPPPHSVPRRIKGTTVGDPSKRRAHRVSKNTKHASFNYPVLGEYTGSKTTELSGKANSSAAVDLTNHLTDCIRATHEEIHQNALESVALEEQSSSRHLTEIVSCDEEKLSTRRMDASEPLHFHYDITDKNGDKIRDIRGIFDESEKELNTLVGEWIKTQRKIACLGVEVVSMGQVASLGSKKSGISKARLNRAASVAREHQKSEDGAKSMLRIRSEEIQQLTREAASGSKVQGKVRPPIIRIVCSYVLRT